MGSNIYAIKTKERVTQVVETVRDFTLIEYIGYKIREYKDAKGWTDVQLSQATRGLAPNDAHYVSQSTLSTIQSGTIKRKGETVPYNTSIDIIENVSLALGVHISLLFPPAPVEEESTNNNNTQQV